MVDLQEGPSFGFFGWSLLRGSGQIFSDVAGREWVSRRNSDQGRELCRERNNEASEANGAPARRKEGEEEKQKKKKAHFSPTPPRGLEGLGRGTDHVNPLGCKNGSNVFQLCPMSNCAYTGYWILPWQARPYSIICLVNSACGMWYLTCYSFVWNGKNQFIYLFTLMNHNI